MSAQTQQRYTPAEYLAREAAAATKSEYRNGNVVAMAGASRRHKQIYAKVEFERAA